MIDMVAAIFGGLVALLAVGWLWFYVVRPIFDDWQIGAAFARLVNGPLQPVVDWKPVKNNRPAARQITSSTTKKRRSYQYAAAKKRLVRQHQYQAQNGTAQENVPAPQISHNMGRDEIIVLLSLQKDGAKYRYSKNQIAALVGGTRAEVLEQIDAIRVPSKPAVQQVHSGARLERPANGWGS